MTTSNPARPTTPAPVTAHYAPPAGERRPGYVVARDAETGALVWADPRDVYTVPARMARSLHRTTRGAWLALVPTVLLLVLLVAGRVDYTGWAAVAQGIEQGGILVTIAGIVWHFLLRPRR